MKEEVVGVVFPILPQQVHRIMDGQKTVFVKKIHFTPRDLKKYRLKKGMKLFLYVSGSGKTLAGEAEIANIEFLSYKEILAKYKESLVLSEKEFYDYYTTSQTQLSYKKPLLVLSLTKVQKYPTGKTYHKTISLSGEYVKKKDYELIIR
ncbi:MAG: DUF365 domain-containing protein [Nitrososphaeria archaeon]|jgi:hypothetical protein